MVDMTFLEKIKVVVDRRYNSELLKRHDGDFFCNKWWCFKVKVETIPMSEIKTKIKSINLKPIHKQIELDIIERGFDYNKGHIYLTNNNYIFDGYHRYFILKRHFDDTLLVTVYRLTDVTSGLTYAVKMTFIHLFVKIYRFLFKRNKGQIIELNL